MPLPKSISIIFVYSTPATTGTNSIKILYNFPTAWVKYIYILSAAYKSIISSIPQHQVKPKVYFVYSMNGSSTLFWFTLSVSCDTLSEGTYGGHYWGFWKPFVFILQSASTPSIWSHLYVTLPLLDPRTFWVCLCLYDPWDLLRGYFPLALMVLM